MEANTERMGCHSVAAFKNLKYPAGLNRGLRLGRTWHRTSRQTKPLKPAMRAYGNGEGRQRDKEGNRGSRGAAPHKHTHQETHESRQHTRRAASSTRPFNPLSCIHSAFIRRDGCVDLQIDVLWMSMSISMSMSMDRAHAGSDLHKSTNSEARQSTG